VIPFQIDPSWYERYWLRAHPPRRRGALAERNWALIEALAEFLTVRWRRNTSSRSGRVGIRPGDKHDRNSLRASPVHNHPGLGIVCKTVMICENSVRFWHKADLSTPSINKRHSCLAHSS